VKPATFDYHRVDRVEDALERLAELGEDAKVLAGGHSLVPLMKLRLAAPTLLVDLRRVPGLAGIESNGSVRIGAMTRHHDVATGGLGLASLAAATIADQQVRNRGTIGGSISHGDPASDLPTVLLALDGTVTIMSAGGNTREVAAGDVFQDYLTTAVGPGEILTEIHLPAMDGWGHGYEKFNRRAEDWAMVGVVALVKKASDGSCEDVRIGLTHMGSTPLRATATENALRGQGLDAQSIASAAEQAAEGTEPPGDLNATPDYKRHLARVLTRRALEQAAGVSS